MEHAIVFDPKHHHLPGTIIEEATAHKLRSRGVATLPIDRAKLYSGPAHGLVLRYFGDAGLHYDANQANKNAHVLLRVEANRHNHIQWTAVIAPIREGQEMRAVFKFVADVTQGFPISGGVSTIEPASLPATSAPMAIVGGLNGIQPGVDGLLAMQLHGIASNVRVLAFGVSVR